MPKVNGLTNLQRASQIEDKLYARCLYLIERYNLNLTTIAKEAGLTYQGLYKQKKINHRFTIPVIAIIYKMAGAETDEIGEVFKI